MWASSIILLGFATIALADVDYNFQITVSYVDKAIAKSELYYEKGVIPDFVYDAIKQVKPDTAAKQALCDIANSYHAGQWGEGVPHDVTELMAKVKEFSQTLYDIGSKMDATYRKLLATVPQSAQDNANKWEAIMYKISNPNREICFCNFLEKGPEFMADAKAIQDQCRDNPEYKDQLLQAFPTLKAVANSDEFKAAQAFFGSEAAMKSIDCHDPKTLERLAKMFKLEDMIVTKPPSNSTA